MKKLRILVLLIILTFSFSVKAEVFLEIDCDGNEISSDKDITCEVGLYYETEGVNDIEFTYQTNLDIEFSNIDDFIMSNIDNKVSIHTDNTLYDKILNYKKISEFKLMVNDKVNEKESIIINNIVINNDIKVDNISNDFNVVKTIKLDDNCTLDSITIEKKEISNFNKDILEYHVSVDKEFIWIDAIRTSDKSMANGLGTVRVPSGKTIERDIVVTSEDKTQKIYKLFITNISKNKNTNNLEKKIIKSSDNSLKILEIYQDNKNIEIDFNNNKNIYDIEINDSINILTIKATLNDSKASFINDYGPRDIKINYGINNELIKIKAEDGKIRTITLNINYIENINIPDEVIEKRVITKKEKKSNKIINIICYIFFGMGVISLILSIFYTILYK